MYFPTTPVNDRSGGYQSKAVQTTGLNSSIRLPHDDTSSYPLADADQGTIDRGTPFYQSALELATSPTPQITLPSQSDTTVRTTEPTQVASTTTDTTNIDPTFSVGSNTPRALEAVPKAQVTTAGDNGGGGGATDPFTGPTTTTRSPGNIAYFDMRRRQDEIDAALPSIAILKRRPGRPLKNDPTAPSYQTPSHQARIRAYRVESARRCNNNKDGYNYNYNSRPGRKAKAKTKTSNTTSITTTAAASSTQNALTPGNTHTIDFACPPPEAHPQAPAAITLAGPLLSWIVENEHGDGDDSDTSVSDLLDPALPQLLTPTATPQRRRGEEQIKMNGPTKRRLASQQPAAGSASPCSNKRQRKNNMFQDQRVERGSAEAVMARLRPRGEGGAAKQGVKKGGVQRVGLVSKAEEEAAATIDQGREEEPAFVILDE